MRHDRHHAAVHEAQLAGEGRQRSRACAPRGVLHRQERPPRSCRRRHPQGHPVRDRHVRDAIEHGDRAQELSPETQGRPAGDPARGRADGHGQASGVLHRRRRHQFRPEGEPAPARTRPADGLPDHVDADGSRRLSGVGQAVARHARDARHLRGQHGHARRRPADQRRRAFRRSHHRSYRHVLAGQPQDPHRHRSLLDQQEHQGRRPDRRRLRLRARGSDAGVAFARRAAGEGRAQGVVEADRSVAVHQLPQVQGVERRDHAAAGAGAAAGAHQGSRCLRRRPRSASTRCGPRSS